MDNAISTTAEKRQQKITKSENIPPHLSTLLLSTEAQHWDGVVDKADLGSSITQANYRLVDETKTNVFLDILKENPGPELVYQISDCHQEHMKLITVNFLFKAITKIVEI